MKVRRGLTRVCFICIMIQLHFRISFTSNDTSHTSSSDHFTSDTSNSHTALMTSDITRDRDIDHRNNNQSGIPTRLNTKSWLGRHSENDIIDTTFLELVLTNMTKECPYSAICNFNGSKIMDIGWVSCCRSCSCDEECGERMDCCFDFLDTSRIVQTHGLVCTKPVTSQNDRYIKSYYMVDKCLNNDTYKCREMKSSLWGSMFPVQALSTGLIYYNENCALCNGVNDGVKWDIYETCLLNYERTHELSLKGLVNKKCEIEFHPRKEASIAKYLCYEVQVDRCNATGEWQEDDAAIQHACEIVQAPVIEVPHSLTQARKAYANIFCKLCNGKQHIPTATCPPEMQESGMRGGGSHRFSSLIDWAVLETAASHVDESSSMTDTTDGQCREFEVKHPYKDECRAVSCPAARVRSNNECKIYATIWYHFGYKIHIKMNPVSEELLPLSAFDSLTLRQERNYKTWFDAKGIPLDHFILYAELVKVQNISYARKLSLIVGSKKFPFNASQTLMMVEQAMSQQWVIRLNGRRYHYDVTFDDYTSFVFDGNMIRTNFYDPTVLEPIRPPKIYKRVLPVARDVLLETDFYITKMFFCEQVQLLPEEWVAIWREEIRLNITETGINKVLGDGQFSVYVNDNGERDIRICVEDFDPQYYTHASKASVSCLSVFAYMCVFILFL